MRLGRDAIRDVVDLPMEEVEVPEWGGSVLVRGLSGRERDLYEKWMVQIRGRNSVELSMENVRGKLAAMCICNETGGRVFEDEDARWLGNKSAAALERVCSVAMRLSGLAAEDVEIAVKN